MCERTNNLEIARAPSHGPARWLPLVLIAAGALAYSNSLSGPFIWDDLDSIQTSSHIRQLWPPTWFTSAPPNSTLNGRPVVSLTVALNYALGELDVRGYHAVNVVTHVLSALVLFGIIRRTLCGNRLHARFGRAAGTVAWAGALLWLVHPIQTESVNYISQRTVLMMGLFYLLTLYCAIRANGSRQRAWWSVAAVAACALGMGSKQVMVTAPVMVVLYDWAFRSGPFAGVLRRRWGLYVGLAATWGILAALMRTFPDVNVGFGNEVGPMTYALNQCVVIMDYLRLTFWPHPLVLDYGLPKAVPIAEVLPQAGVLVVLLVATVIVLAWRPPLGFAGAWFFVTLAPTSSFVPIAMEVGAERRMYLPLAALTALVVVGGTWLLGLSAGQDREAESGKITTGARRWSRWVGAALVTLVAAGMTGATLQRNRDYRSDLSIWASAVAATPDNARAHCNYGLALANTGRLEDAIRHYRLGIEADPGYARNHNNLALALVAQGNPAEAIRHYHAALEINPDFAVARSNLGNALAAIGRPREAIDQYRQALRLRPELAEAHSGLGAALVSIGRLDEAIDCFRAALRIAPHTAEPHYNLGTALVSRGALDEATTELRAALRIAPDHAKAHFNLGVALMTAGASAEALNHFTEAARYEPDWPAPLQQLAWLLATDADSDARDQQKAVSCAERAADLTGHRDARVLDTLAAAYAAAGAFDRAVTTAERALERASANGNNQLTAEIQRRLALYRQKRPFREPAGAQAP